MKKINLEINFSNTLKTFLFGLSGALIFSACTDLNTKEVDSIVIESSGDGFTAGNPAELLNAIYTDRLGAFTDQNNMYALFTHTSDEMIPPTRGVDWGDNGVWRTLHQHTWDATHATLLNTWNTLNGISYVTNQILASNPSAQQAAEARFLRAYCMWHVMDFYGQVPFREVTEGVGVDPRVMTRAEALEFIITDLEQAVPNLPSIDPGVNLLEGIPDNGRASKATAYALLSRIYLNKGVYSATDPAGPYTFEKADMDKVIEYADAVEAEGYSVDPDYFNIFTGDSPEIIWVSQAATPQNRWFMTLHYNQNPSGWNGFATLADFYAKFDEEDVRRGNGPGTPGYEYDADDFGSDFSALGKGFLIGQQYNDNGSKIVDTRSNLDLEFTPDVPLSGAATHKGIRVLKYHPADAGKYILIRYGEVLLNKAEAIMRGGTSTETALDIINDLREVRGADPLGTLDEAALLDERGRELYWEGLRRLDQIRFGTFTGTWDEKTITDPTRVLFPIPSQALASNPNLVQNPGY